MQSKEDVYAAFAELIYSVVMADGIIKETEMHTINQIVKDHPIGTHIQKLIDSENKEISIVQSFLHTLEVCKSHGKEEEYYALLEMVLEIGKVSEGMDDEGLLSDFAANFKRKFLLG